MGTERNYARFYTLLKKLPGADKETLVWQYSNGRTKSLRELSDWEYNSMCRDMQRVVGNEAEQAKYRAELRRARSICLKLMQIIGVDTTDWQRVDSFCENPRIIGKPFRRIKLAELKALQVKLRSIERKGGLKESIKQTSKTSSHVLVQLPTGSQITN